MLAKNCGMCLGIRHESSQHHTLRVPVGSEISSTVGTVQSCASNHAAMLYSSTLLHLNSHIAMHVPAGLAVQRAVSDLTAFCDGARGVMPIASCSVASRQASRGNEYQGWLSSCARCSLTGRWSTACPSPMMAGTTGLAHSTDLSRQIIHLTHEATYDVSMYNMQDA